MSHPGPADTPGPVTSLRVLPPSSPGSTNSSTPPSTPSGAAGGRPGHDGRRPCAAIDTGEHLAVQAGTGTGKSLAYLVPAIRHAVGRTPRSWSPRPRSRCSASSSTATCRGWRRRSPLLGRTPDLRHPQGPPQLPVPQQCTGGAEDDREDELFDPRAGLRDRAARSSGIHEWAETPRPATATSWCPASATGRGGRSRSPRASASARTLPGRRRVFRRTRPGRGRARPTSSSPTTPCSPSTPSRGYRCCPSTTW